MSDNKKLSVAVLGLGRFGKYVAKELFENGADLLLADNDDEVINQMSEIADMAVVCDLADPDAVEKLGLGNMNIVIVAMGSSLESSIMCTTIAKEQGVHRVIAKAGSERMGKVLKKLGADEIVYPEKTMAHMTVTHIVNK
ncbi:K+ transport system, NAD-binding component [Lachnospiraceae bacterium JC7]|nr:K+ transport system, NAD-binding component [Lachnospiraceae bacterium JC7]